MDEFTIASSARDDLSTSEASLGQRLRQFRALHQIDGNSPKIKTLLRLLNGILHFGFAFILLAIMTEFMVRYRGKSRW